MDGTIITAIITASSAVVVAALTGAVSYYFAKKRESDLQWRNDKLTHYRNLLSAISDLAIDEKNNDDANLRFAETVNTIALVAPQDVIIALMNFHNEVKFSNPNRSLQKHDELLKHLLLTIRKDIKLDSKDDIRTFDFHLIGSKPKIK